MRVARVIAGAGGLAHLVAPELLVVPQDPFGPTIGLDPSTWALRILGLVAIVGAVVVGRLATVGRTLIFTSTILSIFFIAWEFRTPVLVLVVPLFVSSGLLVSPSATRAPSVESRRAAIGSIAIGGYLIWRMLAAYADRFTPTHDDSVATAPNWRPDWMWLGAVGPTSAVITAGGLSAGSHLLSYWRANETPATLTAVANEYGVARFELADLQTDSDYVYRVYANGEDPSQDVVPFTTPPTGAHDVTIAFGSCASTGSNGAVFDAIRGMNPDVFVQLGDLHYGNLTSNRPADHITMLGRSLSTPAQSALYSSVPSAWIWDDHDFGPNNSDSTSPARDAALAAYRNAVPHWSVDPDVNKAINQAFTVGRVRIITSDTRSQRTASTMLGEAQEAWLIDELVESARTHALVVWAMPTPWNFPDIPGSDVWGGFPEERRRIANAIATAGISNLVMISGDWHLGAIDDGTNTAYADNDYPGFPLIHGAPLDRPGARTNDPYSHGVFSNAGQFGTVEVADDGGSSIDVTLCVHLWTGERLGEFTTRFDVADV